MRTVI